MPHIHETATVTSKGQITLPKSIRQALGISSGEKVAFDLRGTRRSSYHGFFVFVRARHSIRKTPNRSAE